MPTKVQIPAILMTENIQLYDKEFIHEIYMKNM